MIEKCIYLSYRSLLGWETPTGEENSVCLSSEIEFILSCNNAGIHTTMEPKAPFYPRFDQKNKLNKFSCIYFFAA